MPYKGVDISAIQGNVDMQWLKDHGYSFVINRHFIGNDYKDSMCESNLLKAKNIGLASAIYNFVYPIGNTGINHDPVSQAQLHFNSINDKSTSMAIDIEWPASPSDWQKWGCSAAQISDWCLKYLETYTQLSGNKDIAFYSFPSFIQSVGFGSTFNQYRLWLAQYGVSSPTVPNTWKQQGLYMWQNGGGELLTLPSGVKCDTDLAIDLSWFGISNDVASPEITPIPIITTPVVDPPIPTVVQSPIPTTPALVDNSIVSKIGNIVSNSAFQNIASAAFDIIKKLLHIN